jgi:hypothetical protein
VRSDDVVVESVELGLAIRVLRRVRAWHESTSWWRLVHDAESGRRRTQQEEAEGVRHVAGRIANVEVAHAPTGRHVLVKIGHQRAVQVQVEHVRWWHDERFDLVRSSECAMCRIMDRSLRDFWMHVHRRVRADRLLHGHRLDPGDARSGVAAGRFVAGHEEGGDAMMSGERHAEAHFREGPIVDEAPRGVERVPEYAVAPPAPAW